MESWKLVLLIAIISSYYGHGVCQQSPKEVHGAVVGLSTNIRCDGNRIDAAPFWFINGTVYELFSIPRHFPFIPVVDSYSHLTIPNVPLTVDQTTFQCARFSENGLDNGTCIILNVSPDTGNTIEENVSAVGELVINYQELYILENMTTVSWSLSDTCSKNVVIQGYSLDTGQPVLIPDHVFTGASTSTSSIVVNGPQSGISYKLLGRDESGHECPTTRDIYYEFTDTLEMWPLNFTANSSLCYPIPQTDVCSSGLNFVWASREAGRSCVCPAHNSSAGRWVFESCVEGCRDAALTPVLTEQGSICISNLTSSLNGSLFHFVCSTEPCDSIGNDCFLQTVISSFFIISESTITEVRIDSTTITNFAISSASSAVTVAETTEGDNPLILIISTGIGALFFCLLMLLAVVILCYCYLKKHHGSLTINTKRRRHTTSTKKTAYNTNYISITLPQAVDRQQSNHDQQLQVETTSPLYEMIIPGETKTTNINQTSSDEQQCPNLATLNENLPYLNDQERFELEDFNTHGQLYDTIADIASGSKTTNESIYDCLNHNLPNTEVGANPNRAQNGNAPREISHQTDNTVDGLDGDMGPEAMYSTLDGITEHSKSCPMGNTQGAHITAENGTVKEKASARPVYSVVNKVLKKKTHHTLPNDLIESQVVVNEHSAETEQ